MKKLKVGECREGVTLSKKKAGMLVDIGVEKPVFISNAQLRVGKRVTVKVARVDKRVEAELANRDEIPEYWGYTVKADKLPFGKTVKTRGFDLTIATSKHGVPLANAAEKIAERWKKAQILLVGFGAPTQGLYEIVEQERLNLEEIVDFVVNTIPMQGTETIRTEEALIASLAVLNMQITFKV